MMDIIKIHNSKVKNAKYVIHIADIHIRNFKRRSEYKIVFDRLFKSIEQVVDKFKDEVIIYVGGDIVHTKTDISPELVESVFYLFNNLIKIAPTVVIPGNHDANLGNLNRIDALTPILTNILDENLIYLRDTGVYEIFGNYFIHKSIFGGEIELSEYKLSDDINTIFLYHAPIKNTLNDTGYVMPGEIDIDYLRNYDYGLFGDIHTYQYIEGDKRYAYPGSLIQQNHGELVTGHGFLLWNLETGYSKHFEIENDYSYVTIHLDNGICFDMPSEFTKNVRLRVISKNTKREKIDDVINQIKYLCKLEEVKIVTANNSEQSSSFTLNTFINNIRNIDQQNKLLSEYINSNYPGITSDNISEICKINETYNHNLLVDNFSKNIKWKPCYFKWSNMFSYGEGNEISFEGKNGVYGLFSGNANGKSSVLNSFCYTLFDKSSVAFKAIDVMNNKKDWFDCELKFLINGVPYWIKKRATKNKSGKVKVEIDFETEAIDENGTVYIKNLAGIDRDDTNRIIRSYVGEYDDFILTVFNMQGVESNFITKGQTDRKELLSQFLDLNFFDQLYQQGKSKHDILNGLLYKYSQVDYTALIDEYTGEIDKYTVKIKKIENDILDKEMQSNTILNDIKNLSSEFIKLPNDVRSIHSINSDKNEFLKILESCENEKITITQTIQSLVDDLKNLEVDISEYDEADLKQEIKQLKSVEKSIVAIDNQIGIIKADMDRCLDNINHLKNHEYDPNCKYCIKNIFVQNAEKSHLELPVLEAKLLISENQKSVEVKTFDKLKSSETKLEKLYNLKSDHSKLDKSILELNLKLSNIEISINDVLHKIENCHSLIEISNQFYNDDINNKRIKNEIAKKEEENSTVRSLIKELSDTFINLKSDLNGKQNKLNTTLSEYESYIQTLDEFYLYETYINSVKRDGLPYHLMTRILPVIQDEVNEILSQMVDFKLLFTSDERKINVFIVYSDDRFWKVELGSGMEKFASSIAVRTALLSISSLPHPDIFAIDEGMAALDSQNLQSFNLILDYLRDKFRFILIITHIDVIKDFVDYRYEIVKNNGFSKLNI